MCFVYVDIDMSMNMVGGVMYITKDNQTGVKIAQCRLEFDLIKSYW